MNSVSDVYKFLKDILIFILNRNQYIFQRDYKFVDEDSKFSHILEAVNYVKVAGADDRIPCTYFEFGCHSGRTFSAAIRASEGLKIPFKFYAFDSFQGLPNVSTAEDGIFLKGDFSTSVADFVSLVKKYSGYNLKNDSIIQGYYNESLTIELQKSLPRIGVLHIDVDLYSSTVSVLNFIRPLICPGTVILFDDWYCFSPASILGEKKAFDEFLKNNSEIHVEEWKNYSTFGKSFFVTSC